MVNFSKYHGLGNDFVVLDSNQQDLPESILSGESSLIKRICHRNLGLGADGLIISLPPIGDGHIRMRIFNSDGSEAEMCGNGIRCLVKYLLDNKIVKPTKSVHIETLAGLIISTVNKENMIKVDMGQPTFNPSEIPTTLPINEFGIPEGLIDINQEKLRILAVGMGNPHMVIHIKDIRKIPLSKWGGSLEKHRTFPLNTNVHFVEVKSRNELDVLVWERGCGPTLACGTGACASAVASSLLGLCDNNVRVRLPGGELQVEWPSYKSNVYMTGPAQLVYSGQFNYSDINNIY